jgi:MoaA/NifB/PqqE/SkfB family radical SAM enzyme
MPAKGIMQWATYKRIIKDIGEFDKPIKTLRLYAFGEPLLNPHFANMIQYAKDKGVCDDVDTTTNASQLTPELTKDIIDAGLDRINISIVGMNNKMYKSLSKARVEFDKLVENIAYLYAHKKRCTVFIKINGDIISKACADEFRRVFEPISDGIAIEHIMSCWDGVEVRRNPRVGVYGSPLTRVSVCPYIFYSFCVNFDGVVSTCFLDWNRKLVLGDLDHDSLKGIWEGEKLRTHRRLMLNHKRKNLLICQDCNQLEAGEPVNIDRYARKLLEEI